MIHSIKKISVKEFLELATSAGSIVFDVRSEGEYAQGHFPGAINIPLLDNEQRKAVGICYKSQGQQAAVELGFELVGPFFGEKIKTAKNYAAEKQVFIYCWRGGLRSNIMSWLFTTAGFDIALIEGGYKTIRNTLIASFYRKQRLHIITGKTGVGKTDILRKLLHPRIHFLDLEHLALHRGSAFGGLGQPEQPSQEHFENKIAHQLYYIPNDHSVLIEDESRMIGKVRIPDGLYDQMEQAPAIEIIAKDDYRIQRILAEYGVYDETILEEKTILLQKRMGPEQCKKAIDFLKTGDKEAWCSMLLDYYDKTYNYKFAEQPREIKGKLESQTPEVVEQLIALIQHE